MRKHYVKAAILALLMNTLTIPVWGNVGTSLQPVYPDGEGEDEKNEMENKRITNPDGTPVPVVTIQGTHKSTSLIVSSIHLPNDLPVHLEVSPGFTVSPEKLPAGTKNAPITITLNSYNKETEGELILRSGDVRSYIQLKGVGSPLPVKEIAGSPVYTGDNPDQFVKMLEDIFQPENGYTMEFRIKTTNPDALFYPYIVNEKGVGFKAFITSSGMGLMNGPGTKKNFSNPVTSVEGGLGKFYNDDNAFHTYRYAVTPDGRIHIYRDGLFIHTVRIADYGNQPDFATGTGEPVENLLKNPGFEGEYEVIPEGKLVKTIEGWDVAIGDRYNSEQYIVKQELDNEQDFNNRILQIKRYKWADGWATAEIAQIVDVVPGETYTLSALARGGIKKDQAATLGQIQIREVQDRNAGLSVDVLADSWETYSFDYTASSSCKQLRIFFSLQRDKRGATISPLEIDNVKLTGKEVTYSPKIGFENKFMEIDYFTYDLTGAYAPLQPQIVVSPQSKK